jgi:hypothetical protein
MAGRPSEAASGRSPASQPLDFFMASVARSNSGILALGDSG